MLYKICLIGISLLIYSAALFSAELPEVKIKYKREFPATLSNFIDDLNENKYKLSLLSSSSVIKQDTIFKKRKEKKSIALGVLMSAVLPGSGQFYGENYVKAGIFLGIEALSWATFFYYNGKGDDQKEFFQGYANQNWDVRRYARWLRNNGFEGAGSINPDEQDLEVLRQQIIQVEQNAGFSHTLPEYYTQQYYELIGKYQTFMGGWADAEAEGINKNNFHTKKTPMFLYYAVERQKANDFYDYAKIGSFAAIINHILSAADAAWTISTYNKSVRVQTSVRIVPEEDRYTHEFSISPRINVKFNF
jgi:hypothetical protein